MKILLLGKNGQVGWELQRSLSPLGELIALGRNGTAGFVGDISDFSGIGYTLDRVKPDVVVNASAYTSVDKAEKDQTQALKVNGIAPGVIAEHAKRIGAILVHYSTDYVFNGKSDIPWKESDSPEPVNYYGYSKLAGEKAVIASGCDYLIFRVSWVYSTFGDNFLSYMQYLIKSNEKLEIVSDQKGAPTSADMIADISAICIKMSAANRDLCGLYHLSAGGETNWHEYAQTISQWLQENGINIKATSDFIKPIPTSQYKTTAVRPLYSCLDTSHLCETFGLRCPAWKLGVSRALRELNYKHLHL
jgi:dTDP-4-dehydrorhamnose reductase